MTFHPWRHLSRLINQKATNSNVENTPAFDIIVNAI
jgi:hypothetical protein